MNECMYVFMYVCMHVCIFEQESILLRRCGLLVLYFRRFHNDGDCIHPHFCSRDKRYSLPYIQMFSIRTNTYSTYSTYIHTCIQSYIYIYTNTHSCIHTYMHTYIHIHMYIHTYINTYIHKYINTYEYFSNL